LLNFQTQAFKSADLAFDCLKKRKNIKTTSL